MYNDTKERQSCWRQWNESWICTYKLYSSKLVSVFPITLRHKIVFFVFCDNLQVVSCSAAVEMVCRTEHSEAWLHWYQESAPVLYTVCWSQWRSQTLQASAGSLSQATRNKHRGGEIENILHLLDFKSDKIVLQVFQCHFLKFIRK